jgi:hypothetical protein
MNTRISVEIKVKIWTGDDAGEGTLDKPCNLQASTQVTRCYSTRSKAELAARTCDIIADINTVMSEKLEQNTDANRN